MPTTNNKKDKKKSSKKHPMNREQGDDRARARAERSSLIGATIRQTLYAVGHGRGRISLDGGQTWYDKRRIICDGDYDCLTVTMPDGSRTQGDMGTLLDRVMRKYDATEVERAEEHIRKISHALPRENEYDVMITSKDWLWCIIALMEGDVILG